MPTLLIIFGVILLVLGIALIIFVVGAKACDWGWVFIIAFFVGLAMMCIGSMKLEESPKRLARKRQQHLEKIEQAQRELEHFYIDHPEFRGD